MPRCAALAALCLAPSLVHAQQVAPSDREVTVDIGGGFSANPDQLLLAVDIAAGLLPGRSWLWFESAVWFGMDRDFVSVRPGIRFVFLGRAGSRFEYAGILGASANLFSSYGRLGASCDHCGGQYVGPEFGASLGYRPVKLTGVVGFAGLPTVTVLLSGFIRL